MKVADLRVGATYVGKNGRRRYICFIDFYGGDVRYDMPEGGGEHWCDLDTFARWAAREAPPEEAAPPTGDAQNA